MAEVEPVVGSERRTEAESEDVAEPESCGNGAGEAPEEIQAALADTPAAQADNPADIQLEWRLDKDSAGEACSACWGCPEQSKLAQF